MPLVIELSTFLQVLSSLLEASLLLLAPRPAGPSLRAWTRLQTSVTSVPASKVTCPTVGGEGPEPCPSPSGRRVQPVSGRACCRCL